MPMICGDTNMKKSTKKETRNKIVEEYIRIYSRKYRRAHYKSKWVLQSGNQLAEEDFKSWCQESKVIMRKHKVGLITDDDMLGYINKWIEQDVKIKEEIDILALSK